MKDNLLAHVGEDDMRQSHRGLPLWRNMAASRYSPAIVFRSKAAMVPAKDKHRRPGSCHPALKRALHADARSATSSLASWVEITAQKGGLERSLQRVCRQRRNPGQSP